MDHRVLATHRGDQHVAHSLPAVRRQGLRGVPETGQLTGRNLVEDGRFGEHAHAGVRGQQPRQLLGIQMVRVLVGEQDGVQVGHSVPSVGEVAWIDQNPGVVGFDQHGRMPEVGDLHNLTLSGWVRGSAAVGVSGGCGDRDGVGWPVGARVDGGD